MPQKVLIVDDEAGLRIAITEFLAQQKFIVAEADSCKTAVSEFRRVRPDCVVLDYSLPDGNALDVLRQCQAIDATVPIIILTGHGSIDVAVTAVKLGAEQFLTKPLELSTLVVVIERALENQRNRQKQLARSTRQLREALDPFAGESNVIRNLADQAQRVSGVDCPVLITGETGTGKGVLARWLHENGPRVNEAFVDINCAGFAHDLLETELFGHEKGSFTGAISAKVGLFEVAHRGTIFLDEIGDMDLQLQPKLLKVLEEKTFRRVGEVRDRQVDTRVIAATHQDIAALVHEKKFRPDLYFRINTVVLKVAALRERLQDISSLAESILKTTATELSRPNVSFAPEAIEAMRAYAWPGNLRELRNVIERAVLLSDVDVLRRKHLQFEPEPPHEKNAYDLTLTMEALERYHITSVLAAENGHVERAAARLGIPRSTLYQKVRLFGLNAQ
jgi:DNA-binding NtrC family response regulator